jgi:hypothetical protein
MNTRKNRPANPYTQPIVPQIVKTGEEVQKPELENDKTIERQGDAAIQRQGDAAIQRQNEAATLRQDYAALRQPKEETRDKPKPEKESPKGEQVVTGEAEPEKATIEVRLYLTQTLDDKLLDLRQQYKRRTGGKRIKPNEIMRKLIEKATIEDIL